MSGLSTILLPGLDGTGELLGDFAAALPRELRPSVIEYPPDAGMGYRELECFVADRLPGEGRVVLVAESFSGPLALRLAANAGASIAAVVLVATFVRNPVRWWPRALRPLVGRWAFRIPPPCWLLRRYLGGDDAPVELIDRLREVRASVGPAVLAARVREVIGIDATDELQRCSAPLLYLTGSDDRLVPPRIAWKLHSLRPDMQVRVLKAPHLVLQRQPAESARMIAEFISRVAP